jgi:protein-L-isoaspartate(D-aspartate) O-methyltransferase
MDYAAARQHMIDSQIKTNKVTDPNVIEALASVPREAFVADAQKKLAYIDRPVAIGAGRRMTEPMVLARLLQVANLKLSDTVLVVGAGTGYSAVILARLAKKVVALESAPELAERAKAIIGQTGIGNVSVVTGDLAAGRTADGPYDFILVDGAAEIVPEALTGQLADRGRLAVVIKDQGVVGRGTLFTRVDGVVSQRAIFDADAEVLPGFTRPQRFVF